MKKGTTIGAFILLISTALLSACSTIPNQADSGNYSLESNPYKGRTLQATFQPDWGLPLAAFGDDGNPQGFTIELAEAAADKLGAKINVTPNDFSTTIPGVQSGKFDIGNGTDATLDRQKVVDIVGVTKTGYNFITTKSSNITLTDNMDDLCGLRVAQIAGNSILATLQEQAENCTRKGLKELQILEFPDKSSSFLAVQSRRADATTIYGASGGYLIKQDPSWSISGPTLISGQSGFAVNKQTGNANLWTRAVNALIEDGTYSQILDKYGIGFIGLSSSTVNPAS
ncbi:hypothetical protein BS297_27330 [Rhodococcus erythropolis]|uniref:Solute-binding protein family 3/N-terminal domain-containing protein n=1 Tax=Rhodococcus erythropolis TaxID=1833 RepID=A0A5N5DVK8_RHOER|nr:hypothetical protein BS297_27330 [Rhodococcus erythropolis]